jgi:hypothetical protein
LFRAAAVLNQLHRSLWLVYLVQLCYIAADHVVHDDQENAEIGIAAAALRSINYCAANHEHFTLSIVVVVDLLWWILSFRFTQFCF